MKFNNKFIPYYEKYMFIVGIGGHFIFILQTYQILINGSSENVSLEGFFIALLSLTSWFFYGFLKKDKVLIGVNLFGVLACVTCILAIIMNR